jgi:Protein of unknown function (DUF732)
MKHTALAAAAAVTTALLVAPAAHADAGDDAFLAAMHAKYPYPAEMDQNMINAGRGVCTLLDQGVTRAQLVRSMADLNIDPAWTGSLVDTAVSSYCPQNVAKLTWG